MRLLLLVSCVVAVVLAGTQVPLVRVAHYEPVLNFQVNSAQDQLSFNAYGKLWTFDIWISQVTDKNLYHFHGRLVNAPFNNIASFTLMPEHTTGMIVAGNETFWLEAKDRQDPSSLFIYRTSDVWFHPSVQDLKCQTGHRHVAPSKHHDHSGDKHHSTRRDSFSVAIYKDQYWADGGNNPWASDDQTFGLLNDVNAVYLGANYGLAPFTFQILGQRNNAWTTNDALNNMLNDFSTWSESNVAGSFNLVSWLVGNNVGGLAWVGTACSGALHYRTAVSGLANFSRLWTVKTIAHELGHNRGANHDFDNQCSQGQTSGCQCSVMSYCFPSDQTAGGAVNYFSQASKDQISALQGQC